MLRLVSCNLRQTTQEIKTNKKVVRAYPVPAKNANGIIISHALIVMLSTPKKEKNKTFALSE
jgi:hypothetical protein